METWYEEICRVWSTEHVREIDFMPVVSPPYVMFAENTIGISMKIVKDLYLYAYQRFLSVAGENRLISNHDSLMQASLALLTIKADFPMAYNVRKEVLLHEDSLERYGHEIQILHTLFSRHPKSPSAWQHVRWCYTQRQRLRQQQTTNKQIDPSWPSQVLLLPTEVETEREVCRRSADRYPKNYYAWMHRLWLLPSMTWPQLEDEFSFTYDWLYMHTSDHSAMHHLIHIVHHAVQQITQGELENEQEGFEMIIQAKSRAQSESLETDIVQLATPSVAVGNPTSRWASIVSSALAANFILLVKRPESETLWLGQKMLLLLCAQSLCPEETDKAILREILQYESQRIMDCMACCQSPDSSHASFVSEKNVHLIHRYQTFVQDQRQSLGSS